MAKPWTQTITVSCFESESAFQLYCEPEGAVQDLEPGDVLTLTFAGPTPHGFEISRVAGGIVLGRHGDSDVTIQDKRGRSLTW
jgi:hypothetical protein